MKKSKEEIAENHYKTFYFKGLTVKETREIVSLDYVLTWGFENKGDLKRYKELSKKRILE